MRLEAAVVRRRGRILALSSAVATLLPLVLPIRPAIALRTTVGLYTTHSPLFQAPVAFANASTVAVMPSNASGTNYSPQGSLRP